MKPKGFTLVELLVVITVIAILASVGLVMFTQAQKKARDGKRGLEVDAVAKSLETAHDLQAGSYLNQLSSDFPSGAPADPLGATDYCIKTGTDYGVVSDPNVSGWSSGCPGGSDSGWSKVSGTAFLGAVKSWKVCAKLEVTASLYCRASVAR